MNEVEPSLAPPRGMRDFYPEDMELRCRIFDAWTVAARRFGFVQYDACVVESLELLKRKAGEEIVDQIYAFQDKSGRDLALRAEMTPTLARMVAARQGALSFPIKWFAIAQCFRYERMTRGRKREHYQWNMDIIGEEGCLAEVEILAAAADALLTLGLGAGDFRIHFSSRALLADVLAGAGIEPPHHAAAFLALDKRGKLPDDQIRALLAAEGIADATAARVLDLLALRSLDDVRDLLGRRTPAHERLQRFLDLAAATGIVELLVFDIGVIRGLSYYTGIVFEGFDASRSLRAIFGGGRYDNLLGEVGGQPATGVGLGFGDVVIAEILEEKGLAAGPRRAGAIAVGYMQDAQQGAAIALARHLRRGGAQVDLALGPEKAKRFFARAGRGSFAEAAYLGPDDAAGGTARIKNLETRQEREVPLL